MTNDNKRKYSSAKVKAQTTSLVKLANLRFSSKNLFLLPLKVNEKKDAQLILDYYAKLSPGSPIVRNGLIFPKVYRKARCRRGTESFHGKIGNMFSVRESSGNRRRRSGSSLQKERSGVSNARYIPPQLPGGEYIIHPHSFLAIPLLWSGTNVRRFDRSGNIWNNILLFAFIFQNNIGCRDVSRGAEKRDSLESPGEHP